MSGMTFLVEHIHETRLPIPGEGVQVCRWVLNGWKIRLRGVEHEQPFSEPRVLRDHAVQCQRVRSRVRMRGTRRLFPGTHAPPVYGTQQQLTAEVPIVEI